MPPSLAEASAPLLMRAWLWAVTIRSVPSAISWAATRLGSACTVTAIPAARAAAASRSSASATTTPAMSTPRCRSILRVVTPKWREPTRVIRMVVLSVMSEAFRPSITRRGHLSPRPPVGQRVINRGRALLNESRAGSGETPANLVPHLFAELFTARRSFFFADVEPVEDVEIFEDRVTIACHRQDAEQFGRRPAGAGDVPSAYRVGAVAGAKATELRQVRNGHASGDRVTEIVAKLFQFGACH